MTGVSATATDRLGELARPAWPRGLRPAPSYGAELNRSFMESPDSRQRVVDAAAAVTAGAATAPDAVHDAIDAVATECSNVVNTVAGWFGA